MSAKSDVISKYTISPLDASTWDAFERLAVKHNGVWGGCWCTWFHPDSPEKRVSADGNREYKKRLVMEGIAHAALVFDGEQAIGWAEYGTPAELPNIYHQKEYNAALDLLPDYRITCFFIDRDYRRQGVSALALAGAVDLIARSGGGTVEGYPRETLGKKISASFLYSSTRSQFEKAGFSYVRSKGKFNCVMRKTVSPI